MTMIIYFHTIYKARDGWRWRVKARNGKIVADSGEGYAKRGNATRAWNTFARSFGLMTVA